MLRTTTSTLHRRPPAWTAEVGIFALALVVYQASRALVIGSPATAFDNARALIHVEKGTGLFVETAIQARVLPHVQLVEVLNLFYLTAHWVVTPLFFVWLYRRRRHAYAAVRNAFLVANGLALVVFMLFPVAPPRLAGAREGFVDTLSSVSDVDLHGGVLSGWFNPYAAVPSMHFGYAALVGVVTAALVRPLWIRALALSYPLFVFLVIVGTANHYVIDAIAGGLAMILGGAAVRLAPRLQISNCSFARYRRAWRAPVTRISSFASTISSGSASRPGPATTKRTEATPARACPRTWRATSMTSSRSRSAATACTTSSSGPSR
jgi:PAP2 superfamily